jgi:hypothetical protein
VKSARLYKYRREIIPHYFHEGLFKISMNDFRGKRKSQIWTVLLRKKNILNTFPLICLVTNTSGCPKFFQELHTIHGYKNGNYIPLVFVTKQIRGNVFKMFFFLNKTVQIWDFRLPLNTLSRIITSAIFRFLNYHLYNDKQDLGFESFATKLVPSEICKTL